MSFEVAPYEKETDVIFQRYLLETDNEIRIEAREPKRTRTGIHARLGILVNHVALAWGIVNVERDEERVRLANSAHRQFSELDSAVWPNGQLKKALDEFCYGLWNQIVIAVADEDVRPDYFGKQLARYCGPYVVEGSGTVLFGPPGLGKSTTAGLMAMSMYCGIETLWPVLNLRRVLYVNLERSKRSMELRLATWNNVLGLKDAELPMVNARGRRLTDIYDSVKDAIRRRRTEVLILDSISRAGFGRLTEDTSANEIIDQLNSLSDCWLAIGHTPREDGSHVYGSQMFDAGMDIGVAAQPSENGSWKAVGLRMTKANDMPKAPLYVLGLRFTGDGLQEVKRAGAREFPELAEDRREEIISIIRERDGVDASEIAKMVGTDRSYVSRLLTREPAVIRAYEGRRMLYRMT